MSAPATTAWMLVAIAMLLRPAPASACGCGGSIPSSLATQHADIVFVGTIARIDHPEPISQTQVNADGSARVTVEANSGPDLVVFDVSHVYKGPSAGQFGLLRGNSSCDFPFTTGETWLVYMEEHVGGFRAYKCSRTRLISEATSDLMYLDGIEHKRPQGIVYGDVFRRGDGRERTGVARGVRSVHRHGVERAANVCDGHGALGSVRTHPAAG